MRRVAWGVFIAGIFITVFGCKQGEIVTREPRGVDWPAVPGGEVSGGAENSIGSDDALAEASETILHFSSYNTVFRFSASVPDGMEVEYIPEIEAINIYDPALGIRPAREASQIFIRYFEADQFLTLSTVDVLSREETSIRGHAAVRYEIEKKRGIQNFPNQPAWRSVRHKLVDIRFKGTGKTFFYVFAYQPGLDEKIFDAFIDSLVFDSDEASFVSPLDRADERITKKPFGILIDPKTSPVQPERFSGYHTGADFEVFEAEKVGSVPVRAFCGGKLVAKRTASGYGGVVVQECIQYDQPVTAVYGHLAIGSVAASIGDYLAPGNVLGELGDDVSRETDGERKHLHFAIHKGTNIELRGYVQNKLELGSWIDPAMYIK